MLPDALYLVIIVALLGAVVYYDRSKHELSLKKTELEHQLKLLQATHDKEIAELKECHTKEISELKNKLSRYETNRGFFFWGKK